MHKKSFLAIALWIIPLLYSCEAEAGGRYNYETKINPENVTIARDEYGVPHIFGKTDAEVAYGLAWANAEDAFGLMQESLYSTTGHAGRVKGKEGAVFDFFVHAIRAREYVEEHFDKDISPEFKKYLEGYCQGINAYAKAHKKEVVLRKLFPVTPKDLVQAYMVTFAALVGVANPVKDIMEGKMEIREEKDRTGMGSNAFAMNKNITEDGKTYLCTNPHFRVEGPLSFYEAHLHSEEGLNVTGALFQGGTSVFLGNNEYLGWGQTWNYFDGVDVYELKMHPKKKLWYELDGKWYRLEKRPVWLKVGLTKWFVLPVRKKTYWSKHGMVLKSPNGKFYAVRSLAEKSILAGQQYYEMDKATNYEEFMEALRTMGIGKFNIVYADREGNIYYVSNGLIPDRGGVRCDWNSIIPGDDSKYIWDKAIPVDSLPSNLNPACGYVFNTNNTPFDATCYKYNDDADRLPDYVDERPGENNRSMRFKELVNAQALFNFEDFKRIKFDNKYPETSTYLKSIDPLFHLDPEKYPRIAESIEIISNWDKVADTNSIGATMYDLAIDYLFRGKMDEPFIAGLDAGEEDFVEALEFAQDHLMTHFGTLRVPMKKLQRFVRGDKDYTVPGGPDFLMANYARKPYKDGTFKIEYGDTYIHFVKFSESGPEDIETLLPFSTMPSAENHKNQTLMYQKRQTKKMTLDKEKVLKEAIETYHPK